MVVGCGGWASMVVVREGEGFREREREKERERERERARDLCEGEKGRR